MINYYVKVPTGDDFKTMIALEHNGVIPGILIFKAKLFKRLDDEAVIIQEPHDRWPHESKLGIKTVGDMRRILKEQIKRLKKYEYGSKAKRKNNTNAKI